MAPIPADAAAGRWNVTVRNPDGQSATRAGLFTVNAPPTPPSGQSTWYLAEGTTAWGFDTYITIENPNASAVPRDITYMTAGRPGRGRHA